MHSKQILLSLVTAAGLASASDVVQLKTDTFDEFITKNSLVLAEFYAPWCGHCKALAPEYEVAATELKAKGIQVVKVDCTEEADLCQKQGVEGYPTLKIFRGSLDNPSPYSGQRKSDAIISYMTKQSLPAVSTLTKDTLEAFKTSDKVVVVAYFNADDKKSSETFSAIAEKHRDDYLFGAVSDPALLEAAKITAPGVVVYRSFDEPETVYDGAFEAEAITTFVKTTAIPLIGEVGPETYAGYMSAGIPLAYIFVEGDEQKTKYVTGLKALAQKYKGKINVATIDAAAFGAHAQNLNLESKWPAFAIQDTTKNFKYPFDQTKDLTVEAIEKFVEEFSEGKIEPSIKSEEVPAKQEGPVHVVVAHNYKDIVLDDEKDVLVEFYAHWCGHCKALAPKYEELGKLYFDNPEFAKKVVIAKVDATLNDVPDEIQGFPTIKLFAAGKKGSPIDYQGGRTVEDFVKFIKESGTHGVDATEALAAQQAAPPADSAAEDVGKAAPAATESGDEPGPASTSTEAAAESDKHDEL
ncbi:protein disulfide-isomerase precursor [Orbilia oligospora]|uniref:Protein disulfide-isomerase n=1 Tax=Orbilia oligospora TaxID=2813651 RepID=A0A7C8JXF0_ORBOL|nr:protein disulfide-isomerase precursor [Orbilia oligospora]KAF3174975.1 protein disulfide-isomerase precursor [Orbilia oligospora]KAF3238987.1 protein disulfide-isomerase precursor [Orbilia oligospora]KAF3239039.1 protein disulfide-isomerase precursor [Orbilia oligospora]KAF3285602.1 protein disulfide-isomerase precursor [Orbilia oligospora]